MAGRQVQPRSPVQTLDVRLEAVGRPIFDGLARRIRCPFGVEFVGAALPRQNQSGFRASARDTGGRQWRSQSACLSLRHRMYRSMATMSLGWVS